MDNLFEHLVLPAHIEDHTEEIGQCWQAKVKGDTEFGDIEVGPTQLIRQLADTVRVPQKVEQGAEPSWNTAMLDLVGDQQPIGIVSCKLRYLVAAVEEICSPNLPAEQHIESVLRLHRAAYFGLEVAARTAANEIATAAFYSTVTGLPNRAAFERDIERQAGRGTPIKVTFIDMDGLKIINDAGGHEAGDNALRGLSERLLHELGELDTAYHIQGDEFVLVTQQLDRDYFEDLMLRVYSSEGPKFSYGTACWPAEGSHWREVVNLADERMMQHKEERKERGEAPKRPQ